MGGILITVFVGWFISKENIDLELKNKIKNFKIYLVFFSENHSPNSCNICNVKCPGA